MPSERKNQRGSVLIEGTLTMTAVLLLLLVTIDVGRYVYAVNLMPYLASEATRYASVNAAEAPEALSQNVFRFVKQRATGLDTRQLHVETTFVGSSQVESSVTVVTSYSFEPVLRVLLHGPVTVRGHSSMPVVR